MPSSINRTPEAALVVNRLRKPDSQRHLEMWGGIALAGPGTALTLFAPPALKVVGAVSATMGGLEILANVTEKETIETFDQTEAAVAGLIQRLPTHAKAIEGRIQILDKMIYDNFKKENGGDIDKIDPVLFTHSLTTARQEIIAQTLKSFDRQHDDTLIIDNELSPSL